MKKSSTLFFLKSLQIPEFVGNPSPNYALTGHTTVLEALLKSRDSPFSACEDAIF
jgi:hypothetical protein